MVSSVQVLQVGLYLCHCLRVEPVVGTSFPARKGGVWVEHNYYMPVYFAYTLVVVHWDCRIAWTMLRILREVLGMLALIILREVIAIVPMLMTLHARCSPALCPVLLHSSRVESILHDLPCLLGSGACVQLCCDHLFGESKQLQRHKTI